MGSEIDTGALYEAPSTQLEIKLAEIWQDVLGVENIGVNDDFFDLGGNSLTATVLVSRLHKELEVEVPIKEVFKNSTIKELSAHIEQTSNSKFVSIDAVVTREFYPLSAAQKRLYLLNRMDMNGTSYNMPIGMYIEGSLDVERFKSALQKIAIRHESFRTSFHMEGDEPVQRIADSVVLDIEYVEAEENEIPGISKRFIRPFNLEVAPLLRVCLIRVNEKRHVFLIDMHHIISDGSSIRIIFEDISKLYNGENPDELRIQYKDYAVWQNGNLQNEKLAKQEAYWKEVFSEDIPVLEIIPDFPRPSVQSFEGVNEKYTVDEETLKGLHKLASENGATLFMVLLSAYNILLSKYSGQEDIVVGSPVAGRSHAELENIVGMFVNTLALRNYPSKDKTYREFLSDVRQSTLAAFDNQDYQFEELVEKVVVKRDLSRNPIFDTMFSLQNIDMGEIKIDQLHYRSYEFEYKIAKFDITLSAAEQGGKLELNLEYCTRLYKKDTARRMLTHYHELLRAIVKCQDATISELQILPEEERSMLLGPFNDTAALYPEQKSIVKLFEEQSEKTPDEPALKSGSKQLTYRELNENANRLARLLIQQGVVNESIVGIISERSFEMMIGILAILKAGGAYLPIDSEYPAGRIEYMLKDASVKFLLLDRKYTGTLDYEGVSIFIEDGNNSNIESDNIGVDIAPENLAYVMYTSGSTGQPKGVEVTHRSVVRLVRNTNYVEITECDKILQLSNYAFDGSVFDIFGA
ncbi:MAG: AMP-binding protein, partial [Clostridiaceae bacterium]|nr:AMP-binding protein [Clostridiaceae bacterium]